MSRLLIALPLLAAATLGHAAATAVPVSPQRTTVLGNETQVFSARFYDAQGRAQVGQAVSFFNDACGTFNGGGFLGQATTDETGLASISFTALNTGFIRCTVTAASTAGGSVSYDVVTFRSDPRIIDIAWQIDPAEPRPGQSFRVTASAKVGAFNLYNVDIAARVVPGNASASIPAASFNSGQDASVRFDVTPDGRWGDYDVELSYLGKAVRAPMRLPANPMQDLWWSGAAQNGWGMSIVQHRDALFSIIYAYDEGGKPTWYVMPSGEWNAARTAFTGDVYSPRGAPYSSYDAARFDIGPSLGRATIAFDGANSGSLDYSIRGITGHKAITRILFGEGGASRLPGLGDMWWGGLAQNGWGFSVLQQGRDLFTLWFTYDESGAATWFAMPAGGWTDDRTFRGALYRSAGASWLAPSYDASQFRMNEIGWLSTRYNEDGTATFQYSMGGSPVATLPLTRIPF